ncbi:sigma-54 dependent transcriptional regulator PrdR [Alkaliphilus oremlandii]|uniref:PAS modulated sigma54 specific transcriptional regulator, Fis family n=1 Tax=Alkaliphilus oremlandii (strain OhILAs) TaxID=350688 RepID=A8MEC5_ALKOO|nr:sigma-54 dependent transcriptional regulator PrdR [Alkaliphilus oremlandii]ABW17596.1 PAS modulated sigma54 specific transcriptional regulator, Fis family [Alkaliphilus oremlandii OhILAs]
MFLEVLNNMNVSDVMDIDIVTITKDATLGQAMQIMLKYNKGDVIVLNNTNELFGILTMTDISIIGGTFFCKNNLDDSVELYCNQNIVTIGPDEDAIWAKDLMKRKGIGRLPVIRENKIIGIVRIKDILDKVYFKIDKTMEAFGHILNNIHEAVCVVDKYGKVIFWSKNSEVLYGIKSEDIINKNIREYFPQAILLNVLENRKSVNSIHHIPREGSHVFLSAEPLYIDNEFVGSVSTDRDITEIINLSMELEKTKERLHFLQSEMKKITNTRYSFDKVLGKSESIVNIVNNAKKVARTNSSVLITGESGTGKEVFARALHEESGRKGDFVAINCSAIPESLFESEMFGYDGGAFTGALKNGKIGKIELANKGTLFLDEIGDMPFYMQAKMLRVLQERQIVRIGSDKVIEVDVRIISATHRDLRKLVNEGKFREDLFYRLNVVNISLPSLRKRKEDIPMLITKFIKEFCEENKINYPNMTPEVLKILVNYDWKGNIRELKNAVDHLLIFSQDGEITTNSLPEHIFNSHRINHLDEEDFDLQKTIEKIEYETIKKAMSKAGNNKSKAATILNIPRSTLYYKMNYYRMG